MGANNQLKLAFYGDDMTGSTDAMEALVLAGVSCALFLQPPTLAQVSEKFPDIQAVGLAGMSRTMSPAEMKDALPAAFASLQALGAPVTHYKVCSTFDSSPTIGSIGQALEIGQELFRSAIVPVAVGAPKLKRFVVFGNLFATIRDETYRIDRHPVMSKHPITPMDESDLRLHLGRQTCKKIGLLDVRHLAQSDDDIDRSLQQLLADGSEIVILDTLDSKHLWQVGRLIDNLGRQAQSFVVGSSGVEFALVEYWRSRDEIQAPQPFRSPGPVDQIVAMSGSASPWTAAQLNWAFENGFYGIQLNSARLIDPARREMERKSLIAQAIPLIQEGQSVILYSALGPADPQIAAAKEKGKMLGFPPAMVGEILGTQQGMILKEIIEKTGVKRAAVAGGDTSGHIMKQLSVYVLEYIMPLGTAVPLCRASSYEPLFDGMEIVLKAGQLGEIDFFATLKQGAPS